MTMSKTALNDITQTVIKTPMAALFGANCSTNNSKSTSPVCVEGVTPFSAEEHDRIVDASSRKGLKRKHPSSENECGDLASIPSLDFEDDDESELDDCDGDDDSEDEEVVSAESAVTDGYQGKNKKQRTKEDSSDLIVVLDMDECLIHFHIEDEQKENEVQQEQQELPQETQASSCPDKKEDAPKTEEETTKDDDHPSFMYVNDHKVFLRPGLINFLKFVTTRFQTHIFTAGTKEYADAILDRLSLLVGGDKDVDAFSKRWYRGDCDTIDILDPFTAYCIDSIYVKPLSKVAQWAGRDSEDLRRIVHIDDQPKNFLLNHGNGIRVSEWRGSNPDDTVLSSVTKVLETIDAKDFGDVRPHLRNESYSVLKDHLDMMHLFPHRRTKGIGTMTMTVAATML